MRNCEMEEECGKYRFLDRDMLKFAALIPMTAGHFFAYLNDDSNLSELPLFVWLAIRSAVFAPPVFFFMVAEGCRYTRSRKKYALRLFVFAVITQFPFCLANYGRISAEIFEAFNVLFTLLFGVLAIMIYDSGKSLKLRIFLIVMLDLLTALITSEWMIFGIPAVLGLYIFREKPKVRLIWFASVMFLMNTFDFVSLYFFIGNDLFISLITVLTDLAFMMLAYFTVSKLYNGKKGKFGGFSNLFFYVWYPAHLLMIWFVKYMV